jgi:hypothetical protein
LFGSKKKKILESGVQARALITNVEDTGVTINNEPRVKLTLQVQPEGEVPFEAAKKTLVSRLSIPSVGDTLWVRYDPADRSHVEIDNSNTGAAQPSAQPVQTVNLGRATVKVDGGSTVIDARNVPGLRDEVLKAVEDLRSGKPAAQAELQAAVMKAWSQAAAASGTSIPAITAAMSGQAQPPAAEDPLEKIKKLNELRIAGALTDAEFEAEKAKLLDQI